MDRVCLFGNAQTATAGEESKPVGSEPAAKVLAWLALNYGEHGSREPELVDRREVADALWPREWGPPARDSVKSGLGELKQSNPSFCEEHLLGEGSPNVGLRGPLRVDVVRFGQLCQQAKYDEAVELAQGEFLANVTRSPGGWVEERRQDLRQQLRTALAEATRTAEREGSYARATQLADRRLSLDPTDELAVQTLLRVELAEGRSGWTPGREAYESLVHALDGKSPPQEPNPATRGLVDTLAQRPPSEGTRRTTTGTGGGGGARRRGLPTPLIPLVAAAALAVLVAVSLGSFESTERARGRCPALEKGVFSARTVAVEGRGPSVHASATRRSQVVRHWPVDCRLEFVGYCIGGVTFDVTYPLVPDSRWFILPMGQGLIASGDTAGNPERSLRPRDCPGSVAPPDKVVVREATLDRGRRVVRLAGQAPRAAFIGYALQLPDGRWQRIGWDKSPDDASPLVVDLEKRIPVRSRFSAVACIAIKRGTDTLTTRRLAPGTVQAPLEGENIAQPVRKNPSDAACAAGLIKPA